MKTQKLGHLLLGCCFLLLLLLLLLLGLAGAEQHTFDVTIWPKNPVVVHGGSLWLNCSASCQETDARGSLETSLIKEKRDNGTGWAAFQLVNITEWAPTAECSFSCYGKHRSVHANITVYQIPEQVVLDPLPVMEVGKEYNLTCRVFSVAPVQNLTVTLHKGKEELYVKTFEDHSDNEASDVVVTHTIAAQQDEHGEEVTCHAALDLRPEGPFLEKAAFIKVLKVFGFPEPSLKIFPSQTLVNDSVTIICNSSDTKPPGISLQTKIASGRTLVSGNQLSLQSTLTAEKEDNEREFICEAEWGIGGETILKQTSANLTVFYVPEMDESTCPSNHTWVEGTHQTLHCLAEGNPKPTVACSKEGVAHNMEKEERVNQTQTGVYNCTATNELGSITRTVTIYVEYGPQLSESDCPSNQTWVEGSQLDFICQAHGIPVPDVSCMKDGKVYNSNKLQNITQSHAGVYHCNATNAHGSSSKMVTSRVEYGPEMNDLSCPHSWIWTSGTEQMFICSAGGDPEPTIECIKDGVTYSPGHLQSVTRDYAGTYLCTATNVHGSSTRAVSIQVEYKPEMDESSCPSNWILVEGALPSFICKAEGIPPPEVTCTKDGMTYYLSQGQGIPLYNGTFWCNATNRLGTVAKAVVVTVETKPKMDESSCPSNQTWLEGALHSLACEANGTPTPLVICAKEGGIEEFYRERNVSRNDSGIYQCKATNGHGTERWLVNVQVEYRPVISILAVSGTLPIRRGENFTITCQADGSPAASYSWKVPQASNLNYGGNNSTVTVASADGQNSGVYECTASNKHGQQHSQVEIKVEDHWLYIIAVIAIAAATMLVLGGMAGVIYYLKSTACKKGEYNVRDAENSTEATCLNRERTCDGDIYGIQLTRT
ncbi:intercellular adhesion molecule 5 isoform X1 [Podarcis raffonei]|uniref:intercellular adhesion molecule 5 isoform X1 n=1 Tax=Podarcis raffonei TaxID=65483 RepID=UPI002329943F|nr:intercellular adhesion molecule 5 isoform X1 [Podarcis raffonei]